MPSSHTDNASPARLDSHQACQLPHQHDPTVHVRRVIMTGEMDLAIHRLLANLRASSGSNIDFSTMTRVLWSLALDSEVALSAASEFVRVRGRPKNGDTDAKQEFEDQWAQVIVAGLRATSLSDLSPGRLTGLSDSHNSPAAGVLS